MIYTLWCHSF